ncbi:MAG: hypothetical protein ACLR6J_19165 [Parabacteroides merdae]
MIVPVLFYFWFAGPAPGARCGYSMATDIAFALLL